MHLADTLSRAHTTDDQEPIIDQAEIHAIAYLPMREEHVNQIKEAVCDSATNDDNNHQWMAWKMLFIIQMFNALLELLRWALRVWLVDIQRSSSHYSFYSSERKAYFARYGSLNVLISDNSPQYISKSFQIFKKATDFDLRTILLRLVSLMGR